MQFDPLSIEFLRNPYPFYNTLRTEMPILYWEPWNLYFVSTYADVATLLRDRRLGRSIDHVMTREERGVPPPPAELEPFNRLSNHSMFDKEPPDHTRLRSLVSKAFTPKRVESLRDDVQAIADSLIDDVIEAGQMDILEDFSTPLPVTVIAELLGVPEEDRHYLRPWSHDITAMYELDHTPEQARRAVQAATEFADYLRDLARERKRAPKDDLITGLVQAEEAGDRLTEDELISTCILLLNAGHEATVNVVGNGLLALFQHPDQLQKLIDDPALVRTAIEELMRYDTPLQLFRRWMLEDLTYNGHSFKKGDQLALLFGSANRDPARFVDADVVDVAREDNPHISFSLGVHYCLGAPLARLELEIAFETLLRRLNRLRLAAPMPEWRDTYVIRGLKSLMVEFEPAARVVLAADRS